VLKYIINLYIFLDILYDLVSDRTLGDKTDAIKKNRETSIDVSKEVGLEVTFFLTLLLAIRITQIL
jgi:hypothetical protein